MGKAKSSAIQGLSTLEAHAMLTRSPAPFTLSQQVPNSHIQRMKSLVTLGAQVGTVLKVVVNFTEMPAPAARSLHLHRGGEES